jgi:hypothetical protein
MLYWSFQITVISIILIFLVHHLINFFKNTLTVPKVKDLVNTPKQKYQNIFNTISNKNSSNNLKYENKYNKEDLLPKPDVETMKNELKSFLKNQLKSNSSNQIQNSGDNFSSNFSAY